MALQGTGTSDYAERLSSDLLDAPPITVCFWVRREGAAVGAGPFGLRNHLGSDDNYLMFYNYTGAGGTDYAWESGGGSYPHLGEFTLPLNTWQFVAISRSGTGANQTATYRRLEADGSLTSVTGTFPAVSSGSGITQEVVIAQSYDLTNTFIGRVAHLRQWTSALSEAQLLAESSSATPVITANLHSAHSFTGANVAAALLDESGNTRNLTLNGTLAVADGPDLGGSDPEIAPSVIASAQAFFSPTLVVTPVPIAPAVIASSGAFFSPTLAATPVPITPVAIPSGEAFFAPSLAVVPVPIAPSAIPTGETFFAPTISAGALAIAPNVIPSSEAFFNPTVAPAGVTIAPAVIPSGAAFFNPTLTLGEATIASNTIPSAEQFFLATIGGGREFRFTASITDRPLNRAAITDHLLKHATIADRLLKHAIITDRPQS